MPRDAFMAAAEQCSLGVAFVTKNLAVHALVVPESEPQNRTDRLVCGHPRVPLIAVFCTEIEVAGGRHVCCYVVVVVLLYSDAP